MDIRFGIIGLGRIAGTFAGAVARVSGVSVCAAGSRDANRAEAFAKEHGVQKAYGSYDGVIADPDVQAVYIALTNEGHYEYTKKSLLAGKSVVCEKPFVLTGAQARELAQLANEKNAFLMEGMWTRFMPAINMAKQWIAAGRIGSVRMGDAAFCMNPSNDPNGRLSSPALGGGALFDVGVYSVEFLLDMFPCAIKSVQGVSRIGETGVDYASVVTLLFEDGGIGTAKCAINVKGDYAASLYGDSGVIRFYQFYQCKKIELLDTQGNLQDSFVDDRPGHGFVYEVEHVRDCLKAGLTQSPRMPLSHTIACAEIFDYMASRYGIQLP